MKIEGLGNQYAFGLQGERKNRAESEKVNSAMQRQEQPTGETEQAKIARSQSHHANGAIRNLQEAHFQGVASLRLQIHFQVELQENAMQKADDVLATGSDRLVTDLGDHITTLGTDFQGSFGETDIIAKMRGLMDTFSQAVSNLFSGSEENGPASGQSSASQPGDILVGIQGAFGDFFDGMWQLAEPSLDEPVVGDTELAPVLAAENAELPITPTVSSADEVEGAGTESNAATVDGIVAAETADAPENTAVVPSFTDRLTDLQTWFDSEIASLQYSVDELMNLPSIGQRRGQGMAYSRFLAIYTEMNGTDSSTQASDDMLAEGGVETEA